MSRFSKLIDQMETLDKRDIKNTAKHFAVTATLYQTLERIAYAQTSKSLQPSKDDLLAAKAELLKQLKAVDIALSNID